MTQVIHMKHGKNHGGTPMRSRFGQGSTIGLDAIVHTCRLLLLYDVTAPLFSSLWHNLAWPRGCPLGERLVRLGRLRLLTARVGQGVYPLGGDPLVPPLDRQAGVRAPLVGLHGAGILLLHRQLLETARVHGTRSSQKPREEGFRFSVQEREREKGKGKGKLLLRRYNPLPLSSREGYMQPIY